MSDILTMSTRRGACGGRAGGRHLDVMLQKKQQIKAPAGPPITIPAVAGLGFYLREAYRAFCRDFEARLATHGVTHAQWVMLWFLSQSGTLTPVELSRKAGIQKASATAALEALKRRKLIRGVDDNVDRRKTNLSLTVAGAAMTRELIACAAATNVKATADIGPERVRTLLATLGEATKALGQVDE